jgi:RNA polymerase sigma-70 factor, ECF subfamily
MDHSRSETSMPGASQRTGGESAGARRLAPEEFAARFQGASRVLWVIAAGVLGNPSEAEDILQEAAVMALGKLEQFDPDTHFTAWMGRFVRNVALNQARKTRRRATGTLDTGAIDELGDAAARRRGELLAGPGSERPPIDDRGELVEGQGDFDDHLLAGLRELAPDQRATLLLRSVAGLSYREISATLEIPEGTAMSHVHRARGVLRARLAGEGEGAAIDRRGPEERS